MRARWIGFFLLMFALAIPAPAQGRRGGSSLDRVLPHIRQSVPGTFYDAEGPFFGPNGHPSYRLKWMTPDGRIIWFSVDAQTGQVIGGMPGGAPPGRYRDGDQGSWGAPRNNWRPGWGNGPANGNPWGNGPGNGSGGRNGGRGDDRGNGWGGNGDNRGSGDNRGNGDNHGRGGSWGNGDNGGRGGDNRGGDKDRHRR